MKKRMMCLMAILSSAALFAMQSSTIVSHAANPVQEVENADVTAPAEDTSMQEDTSEVAEGTAPEVPEADNSEIVAQLNGNAGDYVLGFTINLNDILSSASADSAEKINEYIRNSSSITDMGDGNIEIVDPAEFRALMDLVVESGVKEVSANKDENDLSDPDTRLWARTYQTGGIDTEDISDDTYTLYFERGLRGGHEGEVFTAEYRGDTESGFIGSTEGAHPWSEYAGSINKVVIYDGFGGDAAPVNMNGWFQDFSALSEINGLEKLNTSEVTDMSNLFAGCTGLTSISLSGLDLSGVTSLDGAFDGAGLTDVKLAGTNLSGVRSLEGAFAGGSITEVDLSGANFSGVENLGGVFAGENIAKIDLSDADFSGVTSLDGIFAGSNIAEVNLSGANFASAESVTDMFAGSTITKLDLSKADFSGAKELGGMFSGCADLTELNLEDMNVSAAENLSGMFTGCIGLENLDLTSFDTANATNMNSMFAGCEALQSVNMTSFNTENVTDMAAMFSGCKVLSGIYVGDGFNVENVEDGENMFGDCEALVGRNGTPWNPEHTDAEYARLDNAKYHDNDDGTYSYVEGDYGYLRDDVEAEEPIPMTEDILVDLPEDYVEEEEVPEEVPAEEVPAENTPEGDVPTDEAPAGEGSGEETPSGETQAEEGEGENKDGKEQSEGQPGEEGQQNNEEASGEQSDNQGSEDAGSQEGGSESEQPQEDSSDEQGDQPEESSGEEHEEQADALPEEQASGDDEPSGDDSVADEETDESGDEGSDGNTEAMMDFIHEENQVPLDEGPSENTEN